MVMFQCSAELCLWLETLKFKNNFLPIKFRNFFHRNTYIFKWNKHCSNIYYIKNTITVEIICIIYACSSYLLLDLTSNLCSFVIIGTTVLPTLILSVFYCPLTLEDPGLISRALCWVVFVKLTIGTFLY